MFSNDILMTIKYILLQKRHKTDEKRKINTFFGSIKNKRFYNVNFGSQNSPVCNM